MTEDEKLHSTTNSALGDRELKLIEMMFQHAPVAVGITQGPEHRLLYLNNIFRRLYNIEEFIPGIPAHKLMSRAKKSEDVPERVALLDNIYHSGEPYIVHEYETYFIGPKSNEVEKKFFDLLCQPLKDAKGKVQGLAIIGYEITNLVKARREKTLQEQRLRLTMEGAEVGFWERNLQNNKIFLSDQAKALMGLSPEEKVSFDDFLDAMHPEDVDGALKKLERAIADNKMYEARFRLFWPDGTIRWVLSRAQCMSDENGNPLRLMGVIIDITQQKKTEKKLKEAVKYRDNFLSIASHELKTPITSMKVRSSLFVRQLQDSGNKEWIEQAQKMEKYVNQLTNLTENLLDISRVQQGTLKLEKKMFPLRPLIEETVETLGHLSHHNIKVYGEAEKDVYADRFRIGQVLTNLIENAIKYSPDSDRICVRVSQESATTKVTVIDFGIGISEEDREKVFQQFYKSKEGEKGSYPGFGIGLFVSSQIVKAHGGTIEVECSEGEGTTLSFTIPHKKSE